MTLEKDLQLLKQNEKDLIEDLQSIAKRLTNTIHTIKLIKEDVNSIEGKRSKLKIVTVDSIKKADKTPMPVKGEFVGE